jgi:flagellar hook protein FlgE
MQVVDSLGNTHNLTITFTQSAASPNTWSYDVTIPGGDLTGGVAGTQQSVLAAPGNVTFNTNGTLSSAGGTAPVAVNVNGLADGAANMSMNWKLFDSNGNGLLTEYAQTSALASSTQDGNQAAQLNSVAIQSGGQVVAIYSNGQQKIEAQLALAAIQNPTSLENVGNNNFSVSTNTATPAIGAPQTGGRGQILGGSLESSNVDMATEFTNLIVFQSAYQASSRVISTAQTMTQDLLQLIH